MTGRVLAVDDEADFLATYERLLGRQGYKVISVGSQREALTTIRAESLALVIADLRLPDGDGLDVVRAARAAPLPTPAIVVTGFPSRTNRQAALAAGACGYLVKPFATASFTELVRGVLGRPEAGSGPPGDPPGLP